MHDGLRVLPMLWQIHCIVRLEEGRQGRRQAQVAKRLMIEEQNCQTLIPPARPPSLEASCHLGALIISVETQSKRNRP